MPVSLIIDPDRINRESVYLDQEGVNSLLQQRHEMLMIKSVLDFNREEGFAVGLNEIRDDQFWVRGHIPGRPVFPGVLMIETGAQMATIHVKLVNEELRETFFGFAGVNKVKFRRQVLPGNDLIMVTRMGRMRSRSFTVEAQGLVNGKLVFEADIMGMIL